jgi:hypothetical protein
MTLSLAEEFLLLALDDDEGSFAVWTDYGVAGALLADLALSGRIAFDGAEVIVLDPSATGDEPLDRALSLMAPIERPRPAAHWIPTIAMKCDARGALVARLVHAGAVRVEEHRFLSVFPYSRFPSADGAPEAEVVARLRAVLLEGATPDPRTATLLLLLQACSLLGSIASGPEARRGKPRLAELQQSGGAQAAVADAVTRAVGAAVAMMVTST